MSIRRSSRALIVVEIATAIGIAAAGDWCDLVDRCRLAVTVREKEPQMDANERTSRQGEYATQRSNNRVRSLCRACTRFSVRMLLFFILMVAAFLAGRRSRELYPSLWFLGRTQTVVPPQTAYVETGSTLYVATSGPVPRLWVRDPAICNAQPDRPSQFRLLPKKPGSTTVLYWLQGSDEPVELSVVVAANP
jgi:hypothetical protein